MMSDLRDSGAIEQDADDVWLLYRDNYYNKENTDPETEVIVGKNRDGMTGVAKLLFINALTQFVEPMEAKLF
jgi:replicative DNA helicase